MKYINAEEVLNSEVRLKQKDFIINSITKGYNSVRKLTKHPEFEMLNTKLGKEVLPYVRRLAISYQMDQFIDSEIASYTLLTKPNTSKNCHHIELESKRCKFTVNHTSSKYNLPRKAKFRENLILDGQLELNLFDTNIKLIKNPRFYIMITHGGYLTPKYINVGIPSPDGKSWLAFKDILKESIANPIEHTESEKDKKQEEKLLVNLIKQVKQDIIK